MKKLIICLVSLLLIVQNLSANPIFLQSLISEIYFDDEDNWYMAIDNWTLMQFGIAGFDSIHITSNEGELWIKEDFLPDFSQETTIMTNENLYFPVQIQRSGDSIVSQWEGGFEFTTLVWNDVLPSPVCGPLPGQSLYVKMVYVSDESTEWWLVKNSNPTIFNSGYPLVTGSFTGYVYDLLDNPVPNALIHYIDESYFFPYPVNPFVPLWTNSAGYFQLDNLPARNYCIEKIEKDGQNFIIDQYISLEPGMNEFSFNIDYVVGNTEHEVQTYSFVRNYPNPATRFTTFEIQLPEKQRSTKTYLQIHDLKGQVISVLPVWKNPTNSDLLRIQYAVPEELGPGTYAYCLVVDGKATANGKMNICR